MEVVICDPQETGKGLIFPELLETITSLVPVCFLLITCCELTWTLSDSLDTWRKDRFFFFLRRSCSFGLQYLFEFDRGLPKNREELQVSFSGHTLGKVGGRRTDVSLSLIYGTCKHSCGQEMVKRGQLKKTKIRSFLEMWGKSACTFFLHAVCFQSDASCCSDRQFVFSYSDRDKKKRR